MSKHTPSIAIRTWCYRCSDLGATQCEDCRDAAFYVCDGCGFRSDDAEPGDEHLCGGKYICREPELLGHIASGMEEESDAAD
jgi:hypothetical protein